MINVVKDLRSRRDARLLVALIATALVAFGVGLLIGTTVLGGSPSSSSCVAALDMAKHGVFDGLPANATMDESVRYGDNLVRFAVLDHDCRGLRPTDLG
jgi:hypothetical protein